MIARDLTQTKILEMSTKLFTYDSYYHPGIYVYREWNLGSLWPGGDVALLEITCNLEIVELPPTLLQLKTLQRILKTNSCQVLQG